MGNIYIDLDGCLLGSRMDNVFRWLKARVGFNVAITLYYAFFWDFTMPVSRDVVTFIMTRQADGWDVYVCTGRNKGKLWLLKVNLWLRGYSYGSLFKGAVCTPLYRDKAQMRVDGLLVDNSKANAEVGTSFLHYEFKPGR